MKTRAAARPCLIQVRRSRHDFTGPWVSVSNGGYRQTTPRVYRSVRQAKRSISDVYFLVDRLSRATYDVRILDAKTGAEIPISEARVEFGISRAFIEQRYNSIGECLRRGEAVAV
jgi:hypothetical protein